jgi:hypothetical protein
MPGYVQLSQETTGGHADFDGGEDSSYCPKYRRTSEKVRSLIQRQNNSLEVSTLQDCGYYRFPHSLSKTPGLTELHLRAPQAVKLFVGVCGMGLPQSQTTSSRYGRVWYHSSVGFSPSTKALRHHGRLVSKRG